jgi:hypothetical protein
MFGTASLHLQGIPLECLTTREVVAAVAAAVEETLVVAVAAVVEEIGVVAAGEEAETSVAAVEADEVVETSPVAVEEETEAAAGEETHCHTILVAVAAVAAAEEPAESTCEFVPYCPHMTSLLTHFPATERRSLSPMPTSQRLKTSSSNRLVAK